MQCGGLQPQSGDEVSLTGHLLDALGGARVEHGAFVEPETGSTEPAHRRRAVITEDAVVAFLN